MVVLKSALVSGLLMGVLAVAGYVIGVGDVFKLNAHALINSGVMALLTTMVSLVKAAMTTDSGKALGVQVKDPAPPQP